MISFLEPRPLLTPKQLHDYQKEAVTHMLRNKDSMLWLGMGLGKLQPDSEPILTPSGWKPMGHISVGDFVIGADGKPTEVTGVFPQGECEIVTVTFNDGSWTRCGWDHLWAVTTDKCRHRGKPARVLTTRELVDQGLTSRNGKNGTMLKWSVRLVDPVQYPEVSLPVEPYLLGVILGDGTVTKEGRTTVCTDKEIIDSHPDVEFKKHHSTSSYTGYGLIKNAKDKMAELSLLG